MTIPDEPTEGVSTAPSSTGWPTDPESPVEAAVEPLVEPELVIEPEPAPEPGLEPEPIVEPVASGRKRRRLGGRHGLPTAVLALVLMTVLMAAADGYLWYAVHRHTQTEAARRDALTASRDAARVLFSYDYKTLAKDFSAGRALTTGAFRKEYENTTSKVVSDVATRYKAVVRADVVNAGVVTASPNTVVTIVYVNQVSTSTRVTGQKLDLSRVRMTLQRVGGRWLVSSVQAL